MLGPGYLYVLRNPRLPGRLKIGMTRIDPVVRAEQVTQEYGVGTFHVVRAWPVRNPEWYEAMVHRRLHRHRVSLANELFRVTESDVDEVVRALAARTDRAEEVTMFDSLVSRPRPRTSTYQRPLRVKVELLRRRFLLWVRKRTALLFTNRR